VILVFSPFPLFFLSYDEVIDFENDRRFRIAGIQKHNRSLQTGSSLLDTPLIVAVPTIIDGHRIILRHYRASMSMLRHDARVDKASILSVNNKKLELLFAKRRSRNASWFIKFMKNRYSVP